MMTAIQTILGLAWFAMWLSESIFQWDNSKGSTTIFGNLQDNEEKILIFFFLNFIIPVFFFVIPVLSVARMYKFAKKKIGESFEPSDIDLKHFLDTVAKNDPKIVNGNIFFGNVGYVDVGEKMLTLAQPNGAKKEFRLSTNDVKKIQQSIQKNRLLEFYQSVELAIVSGSDK